MATPNEQQASSRDPKGNQGTGYQPTVLSNKTADQFSLWRQVMARMSDLAVGIENWERFREGQVKVWGNAPKSWPGRKQGQVYIEATIANLRRQHHALDLAVRREETPATLRKLLEIDPEFEVAARAATFDWLCDRSSQSKRRLAEVAIHRATKSAGLPLCRIDLDAIEKAERKARAEGTGNTSGTRKNFARRIVRRALDRST